MSVIFFDHRKKLRECPWLHTQIAERVVSGWIANVAGNDPYKIMFALVALFTIVGDFIEPIPCIVIFMPIVAA
jgi:TRAP-type C4-dicarboxylate transport system permease large subunit